MARVSDETIASFDHTGLCMVCDGKSAAAWSPSLELCLDCITTILPKLLVDALENCDRATIYRYREKVQGAYWQAAFARLERETRKSA